MLKYMYMNTSKKDMVFDLEITDTLHRFLFENTAVRGNTVQISETLNAALEHQQCPAILRQLLGELMSAAALLTSTIKMQGALILQLQGSDALKMVVVECTSELTMRATAKWEGKLLQESPIDLLKGGQFVITLDPKDGGEGYQGIVPIEGQTLSEVLQNYMLRSEQIETRIWLACDTQSAAGLLIQKLPQSNQQHEDTDTWPRACMLADTVQTNELLHLPAATLLTRLFHEEQVRLFEAQSIRFYCSCSQQGVASMLRMLGKEEVDSIIEEQGSVEVHCDFCNARYVFEEEDIAPLFSAEVYVPSSTVKH